MGVNTVQRMDVGGAAKFWTVYPWMPCRFGTGLSSGAHSTALVPGMFSWRMLGCMRDSNIGIHVRRLSCESGLNLEVPMRGDTIFAPATGTGNAALSICRISGPHTEEVVLALCGDRNSGGGRIKQQASRKRARGASVRVVTLRHPLSGQTLDNCLLLQWAHGSGFTGEAAAEFHLHGGTGVMDGVLAALREFEFTRPALPGEFTQRALLNGRLSASAAEAVGGCSVFCVVTVPTYYAGELCRANSAASVQLGLRALRGEADTVMSAWREQLLRVRVC